MNPRIRQLAEQANMVKILEERAHEYGNGMFENTPYPELEKFAELIVRECMNIADEYDGVGSTIVSRIKKHFGVDGMSTEDKKTLIKELLGVKND